MLLLLVGARFAAVVAGLGLVVVGEGELVGAAGATEAGAMEEQFSDVETFGYEYGEVAFGARLSTDGTGAPQRHLQRCQKGQKKF